MIIESWQGAGVRKKVIKDWEGIDEFKVDGGFIRHAVRDFALAACGKKYDYLSVARFITRSEKKNPEKYFCSELVFAAFAASGLNLLERIRAEEVSPQHLSLSPFLSPIA